ncbi:phosphotransferase [Bremerella sp. JC770]|uniref:phosphotransferase n=1 Tax=Bremerella sp. JC770 TaxID=3232137 RepID=UPI00345A6B8B
MSINYPVLMPILAEFEIQPHAIRDLVDCEGGLSGAHTWRVDTDQNRFCLKLMPPDVSVNRLQAAHHAADQRRQKGMHYLAGYQATAAGQTYVESDGRLWELQTWMDGQPPTAPFTYPHQRGMFQAIAEFHALHESPPRETAPSPGIRTRLNLLDKWRDAYAQGPFPSLNGCGHPQWNSTLAQFLDSFVRYHARLGPLLSSLAHETYLLEDCIADPRPDNFRFAGYQLTGLFDLGSMRWDNIALDVARLASEVSEDGEVDWDTAMTEVNKLRPLTPSEERLAMVLDAANVLLTGLNWVQWLVVDGITFANCDHVSYRLAHISARLEKIDRHPAWSLGS